MSINYVSLLPYPISLVSVMKFECILWLDGYKPTREGMDILEMNGKLLFDNTFYKSLQYKPSEHFEIIQ